MRKTFIASVDTGNKNSKVFYEGMEKPILFPNALCNVTEFNKKMDFGVFNNRNANVNPINLLDVSITTNGRSLGRKYFGGLALKHGIEERPLNKKKYNDDYILFVALISLAYPLVLDNNNHNKTINLKLGTCLPTEEYILELSNTETDKHPIEIYKERLIGTHTIKFNDPYFKNASITLEINKDDIMLISEGFSALLNMITDDTGKLLSTYENVFNNEVVLLVDCGGGTTDIASLRGTETITQLIDFLNEGILSAQYRILNRLKKIDSNFGISKAELDFSIRKRNSKVIRYGEEWDISDIVKEEFEVTGKNIAKNINDLLYNASILSNDIKTRLKKIFLTGGASMFFESYIKEVLDSHYNIITSTTPLYDNVMGAYKIIKTQVDVANQIENEPFLDNPNIDNLKEETIKKSI